MLKFGRSAWSIVLLLNIVLSGCAGFQAERDRPTMDLKPGQIADLKAGRMIGEAQLIEDLARAEVVIIGEYHNHTAQHRNQLTIIKGLYKERRALTVALEVFARPEQPLLNQWVAGELDQADFIRKVNGPILNPGTFRVYFPILEWARQKGVPLLALNAPRPVVSRIARDGLAALSPVDRRKVAADIVVGPEPYKKMVLAAMEMHHSPVEPLNFFTAQVTWDETMAETLTEYARSERGRGRLIVLVAGNQHVYQRYGLPDRVVRRGLTGVKTLIAPVPGSNMILDASAADFAWMTEPQAEEKRPRLGVLLENDAENRLTVKSVVEGGVAEEIGILPGDVLLEMDGRELKTFMDMHQAAVAGGAEADHSLIVERDGRKRTFSFRFRSE